MVNDFEKCRNIRIEILKIEERICELKSSAFSPKNQIITGMPKGNSGDNAMETYIMKSEKLKIQKKKMEAALNEAWENAIEKIIHLNDEKISLMKLRFYFAMPWNKCCKELIEKYPNSNWNINKCFRIYRGILITMSQNETKNKI